VGLTLNLPNGVPANVPKAYLQLQAYDEQGQTAGQQTRFVAEQNSCLSDLLIANTFVEHFIFLAFLPGQKVLSYKYRR
jgi:hypothetical protein